MIATKSLLAVDPASAQAEAVREGIQAFHQHRSDWKVARQYFHEKWYCPKEKPWDAQDRPLKWNGNRFTQEGSSVHEDRYVGVDIKLGRAQDQKGKRQSG